MGPRRQCKKLRLIAVIAALAWMTPALNGQSGTKNGEWRTYGGDLGNTRYAPLDQINAANFNKLEVAWRFKTDNLGPRPEFQFESTPLMVNGVLYSTAGTRRAVVALDAATGELLWMHSENEGQRGAAAPRQLSGRGLAYWTDGREERILYVTPGYRLVALDAKTGAPHRRLRQERHRRSEAGRRSGDRSDHRRDRPARDAGRRQERRHHRRRAPVRRRADEQGATMKGYVRGFDVRTGKRLWIFHTIPPPGEFGNDTWENDSWSYTGNTGVWAQMTVDEELGLAYLPVEMPTGDYYGGHRPGNDLFGESLVAVDLKTGKRKWHYQLVHHGIWDMDIPCAPILADITVNGRTIKAVAQPTKQALALRLRSRDRRAGLADRGAAGREGRRAGRVVCADAAVPHQAAAPTIGRASSIDDLIDFTPELRAEAVKIVAKYKLGPIFTPPVVSKAEGPLATLTLAVGRRRHQLARRLVRSRDPHRLRLLEQVAQSARPGAAAGSDEERHEVHPGQRRDRRADARRRRIRAPAATGPARVRRPAAARRAAAATRAAAAAD